MAQAGLEKGHQPRKSELRGCPMSQCTQDMQLLFAQCCKATSLAAQSQLSCLVARNLISGHCLLHLLNEARHWSRRMSTKGHTGSML